MLSPIGTLAALIGHARARHLLVACGLLIGLALAVGAALMAWELRRQHLEHAERDLKNIALILSEEVDRSIQSVELVQLDVIRGLRNRGVSSPAGFEREAGSFDLYLELNSRIANLSQISSLALVDRDGRRLNITRSWPSPMVDDADRDFIQAHTGPGPPGFFISAPSQSKSSDKWTIYFSRGFSTADGELIGIVIATIETEYLEQFFSRIALDNEGSFALYRRDGMLLARYPNVDHRIGKTFGDTSNFNRVLASLDQGAVRQDSLLDGRSRLIAPHSLAHYPLLIAITNTMDAILADWRIQVRVFGGATLLLELIIGAAVVLLLRHLRESERLEASERARTQAESELALAQEHDRAERQMHAQSVRFETALNTMLQGLLMVDHAGRLLVVNRRYLQICGLPDDAMPNVATYDELMAQVVAHGNILPADMLKIRERRLSLIDERSRVTFDWDLSDGRAFTVNHQPMEEGWLATYEDITGRRQAESRIAYMAQHDALTDLPNRVLFHDRLERALAYARRGQNLALLYLDLDQFKAVNDTLGHPIGDRLLQEVSRRLLGSLRETDTLARLGGDEFAIVQPAIGKPTDATTLAGRLIELFEVPFDLDEHQILISTSIGIALAPQDALDVDQLLKCADLALYKAKQDGRGMYRLFQADMDAAMQARRLLELDLRQALKLGQFEVYYQPLINLQAGAIAGFEALVRWHHPSRGFVQPDAFIPLAEEIGVIVPMGEWVLREACTQAAVMPGRIRIAVNLSAAQFKSRNLVGAVAAVLRDTGLDPDRLELEITETVMLQDTEATLATLSQLREFGVHTAMDDFGTGYSSLSYLRRFPFDRIKIDRTFVSELGQRADFIAIIRAVTTLGNDLGMETTGEGVETTQQLDALALAGCTEVQGYLFSKAVPISEVPGLLRSMPALVARLASDNEDRAQTASAYTLPIA